MSQMKNKVPWLISGAIALIGAALAVTVGFAFTGWALVGVGPPTAGQWAVFLGASAVFAFLGAIPGISIGVVVALVSREATKRKVRMPPKKTWH
jgi:hypothetical protein